MTVNKQPASLAPGDLSSDEWRFGFNMHGAPASGKGFYVQWHEAESESAEAGFGLRPGEVAFKLVREVYAWFEFEEDKIPYSEGARGAKVISPQEIRRLNP